MKLVFEMIDGEPYMWDATEKRYNKVKSQLSGERVKLGDLAKECYLGSYGDNFHMVFNLKDKK